MGKSSKQPHHIRPTCVNLAYNSHRQHDGPPHFLSETCQTVVEMSDNQSDPRKGVGEVCSSWGT